MSVASRLGRSSFVPLGLILLMIADVHYLGPVVDGCREVASGWPLPWRVPNLATSDSDSPIWGPLALDLCVTTALAYGLIQIWGRQGMIRNRAIDALLAAAIWLGGAIHALLLSAIFLFGAPASLWYGPGDLPATVERVEVSIGYGDLRRRTGC
jgi:hypothetical protein